MISPGAGPINQMSLAHGTIHTQDEGSEPDAREVETENKLLFLVTENGSLLVCSLPTVTPFRILYADASLGLSAEDQGTSFVGTICLGQLVNRCFILS